MPQACRHQSVQLRHDVRRHDERARLSRDNVTHGFMFRFAHVVQAQQPRRVGDDHLSSPNPERSSSTREAMGSATRMPAQGRVEATLAAIASRMICASDRPDASASASRAAFNSSGS